MTTSAPPRLLLVADPPPLATRLRGLLRWEGDRLRGVRGYFLGSLATAFRVDRVSPEALLRDGSPARGYDFVCFDYGDLRPKAPRSAELAALVSRQAGAKLLLDARDNPAKLAPDGILDLFDAVFKREPYRDRGRYAVSADNRAKLHATMLPCLSLRASRFRDLTRISASDYGPRAVSRDTTVDVFFAGAATSTERVAIVERLRAGPFVFRGGLHEARPGADIGRALFAPRLSQRAFAAAARDARINLALAGRGPFTFRHLDFWHLACFMLSSPEIATIETPLPFVEGRHYVSFTSLDDLVDKCRYYLDHDDERVAIAEAGRQMFDQNYSFVRHGKQIAAAVGLTV